MKTNLLKAERTKYSLTQKDVSKVLNIDSASYSKRENGILDFKSSEINILKHLLNLDPKQIDEIFFDIKLEFNSNDVSTA